MSFGFPPVYLRIFTHDVRSENNSLTSSTVYFSMQSYIKNFILESSISIYGIFSFNLSIERFCKAIEWCRNVISCELSISMRTFPERNLSSISTSSYLKSLNNTLPYPTTIPGYI